ncbi:unnamed protein product [Cyprideis torosa]|uniref:Uncharacterized protein n=1 Tax=Cyprideis torosa TaxID=163714 RepID=A0A7R8ZKP5_9CRUS|nr:unnamed protein product [Cyprideis torosa]CAG0889872.1 unnamed protein product [Cyprideis torosa]
MAAANATPGGGTDYPQSVTKRRPPEGYRHQGVAAVRSSPRVKRQLPPNTPASWFQKSLCTLFLNKYILTYLKGDPALLGGFQMIMTAVCGLIQLYFPCGMYKPIKRLGKPPSFFRNMVLVGSMRFSTVVLGLIALKYVAVSFTETIKSSAPLFTVLISRSITGEQTGVLTMMSLIPIMGGLALCTANELSFDAKGFAAALATNITECLQNVYSKVLISGEKYRYTPAELQFYTSVASLVIQIPLAFILVDWDFFSLSLTLFFSYVLNGFFFHCQSITAYVLMDYISPVTHSVANTAKRALLILLSIWSFGNEVTLWSAVGTIIVFIGVFLYNQAKVFESRESLVIVISPEGLREKITSTKALE